MKYYIVDAFTQTIFAGNQAGVCLPDKWPDDTLMQDIAAENNLSETAFIVRQNDGYGLRWFTPKAEVDLCGHATLAGAYVIANFIEPAINEIIFHTKSGQLTVTKKGDLYELDFPARKPRPTEITALMTEAIGEPVLEAFMARDLLLLIEKEEQVQRLQPHIELLKSFSDCLGIIVTARGEKVDFVSRFFAPQVGIDEDPVTGSAHCTLIPFWAERLGKDKLTACQLSSRGGELYCQNMGERVKIAGYAALFMEGEINLSIE